MAGLIGRPHQDLSPPKEPEGFWRSSHSSGCFTVIFGGFFFQDIWTSHPLFGGKINNGGHNWIRESFYKSGFHWQKRDCCAQKTPLGLLGLKMRTTSWSFVGQCGLLYQCADQLDQKITIKFHKDKKSRYNYMRTQKETLWTCAERIEIKKTKKDLPQKKETRNLTCNKTSGLFSPFVLDVKNDSSCVRLTNLLTNENGKTPESQDHLGRRSSLKPTASFSRRILGVPIVGGGKVFPYISLAYIWTYIGLRIYLDFRYLKCLVKFAPENMPIPKGNESYSSHPFSGANLLVSGRVVHPQKKHLAWSSGAMFTRRAKRWDDGKNISGRICQRKTFELHPSLWFHRLKSKMKMQGKSREPEVSVKNLVRILQKWKIL